MLKITVASKVLNNTVEKFRDTYLGTYPGNGVLHWLFVVDFNLIMILYDVSNIK